MKLFKEMTILFCVIAGSVIIAVILCYGGNRFYRDNFVYVDPPEIIADSVSGGSIWFHKRKIGEISLYEFADSLRECFEARPPKYKRWLNSAGDMDSVELWASTGVVVVNTRRPKDTIWIDTCYGFYADGRRWYGRGFFVQHWQTLKFCCGKDTPLDSLYGTIQSLPKQPPMTIRGRDGNTYEEKIDDSLIVRDANGIVYEVDTNVWQRKQFLYTDSGLNHSALPFLFTGSGCWIFSLKDSGDCDKADWNVPIPAVMNNNCGGWQKCSNCRMYIRDCVDSAFTGDSSTIMITEGALTGKRLRVLEWVQRPTCDTVNKVGGLFYDDSGETFDTLLSFSLRYRWVARVEGM